MAAILKSLGAKVIDADRIARDVLESPEVLDRVVAIVGQKARDRAGRPDRPAIARAVFGDEARLERLNRLIHPAVRERIAAEIDAAGDVPAVVVDAPLLVEGDLDRIADTLVFVAAAEEVRAARAAANRGWDLDEVAEREARQAPLDEKRRRADHVIENDGDLTDLSSRVKDLFRRIAGGEDGI